MKLTTSFNLGTFRCHLLEGGRQRLDGGAMFGVVPKPLWSKKIPPDERNRIPLTMRCLLVEHPDGLVLVDTGLGDKEDRQVHRHLRGRERRQSGTHTVGGRLARRGPPARGRALGDQYPSAF